MQNERSRALVAEFVGTMFLLIGVVGSGIMAERLSPNDVGLQLLQNAVATAAVLMTVISIFGTISADFNPAVTVGAWLLGHRPGREVVPVVATQVVGACAGTVVSKVRDEDSYLWGPGSFNKNLVPLLRAPTRWCCVAKATRAQYRKLAL